MKVKKLTGEDGEVKFEVYQITENFGGYDSYIASFSKENLAELKAILNARNDI